MRRKDKLVNMKRVNLLFESRVNGNIPLNQTLKESPKFGGQNVSQEMRDELQYDKDSIGKAMGDTFQPTDDYQMKNYIEIGGTYIGEDGDSVKVVSETPEGLLNIILTPGEQSIEQYKKWGMPAPSTSFKLLWSKPQFDYVMGEIDDHDESQYQGERHGY